MCLAMMWFDNVVMSSLTVFAVAVSGISIGDEISSKGHMLLLLAPPTNATPGAL